MSKKRNVLFEDANEDAAGQLSVNKDFAEKFEQKKQQEELSRLEEKYGKGKVDDVQGSTDTESEEEDEDGELLTPSVDAQILTTLGNHQGKERKDLRPKWRPSLSKRT